jgi:hypothetical protein
MCWGKGLLYFILKRIQLLLVLLQKNKNSFKIVPVSEPTCTFQYALIVHLKLLR